MNRMLDLLYAGECPFTAALALPIKVLKKYFIGARFDVSNKHLTTMLLLIAVAEGEIL